MKFPISILLLTSLCCVSSITTKNHLALVEPNAPTMEGTNHLLRQRQLEDLSLDDPSMDNNSTDSPSVDDPSFLDDLSEKASSPFQIEVSSAFHPLFTKATALTASAVYFLV